MNSDKSQVQVRSDGGEVMEINHAKKKKKGRKGLRAEKRREGKGKWGRTMGEWEEFSGVGET